MKIVDVTVDVPTLIVPMQHPGSQNRADRRRRWAITYVPRSAFNTFIDDPAIRAICHFFIQYDQTAKHAFASLSASPVSGISSAIPRSRYRRESADQRPVGEAAFVRLPHRCLIVTHQRKWPVHLRIMFNTFDPFPASDLCPQHRHMLAVLHKLESDAPQSWREIPNRGRLEKR